jgi:hypothetical protein
MTSKDDQKDETVRTRSLWGRFRDLLREVWEVLGDIVSLFRSGGPKRK